MNNIIQDKQDDMNELRILRQMVLNADKQLLFNQFNQNEYQYILSKVIANLEVLEIKYGLD